MSVIAVDAYLDRLGLTPPERPDAAALRRLHAAHLERVPFENLDIAFGVPISLRPDALADKILHRRRGGFCYELNGLFASLLAALGYEVTLLAARVWTGERFGPPLDHLALRVGCGDGSVWLADVGFGAHSRYPLPLLTGAYHDDPDGTFRLTGAEGDLTVSKDGAAQYRVELHPRELDDFAAMCWYQQHSPASHFTRSTVCSRSTADGRVSISEDVLIVTVSGNKRQTTLTDDAAILAAYHEHFGVDLQQVPRIRTR